jgi:hypothetical protein
MLQGFLLPRGPRSSPEARAGRTAQPVARIEEVLPRLTVRLAEPVDDGVLGRLAGLDSARLPDGPLLVGEISGSIQAAVPVFGGRAIANPFVRTAELVSLLEMRAEQLREQGVGQLELARVIPFPRRRRQALTGRIA